MSNNVRLVFTLSLEARLVGISRAFRIFSGPTLSLAHHRVAPLRLDILDADYISFYRVAYDVALYVLVPRASTELKRLVVLLMAPSLSS